VVSRNTITTLRAPLRWGCTFVVPSARPYAHSNNAKNPAAMAAVTANGPTVYRDGTRNSTNA
jgi:hypothetical protein